ncbi:hypothetical protein [Variovorax arabinosiphilus]|uniref:hypothetical protein n=1 Tax=Variovorax arabinosiphilus TaxID=3053498 RepID=UPI0025791378|nr:MULTISPECIES: hypothetical protein [unclassified Variovorax]MDM0118859.1 hypothetical protein [Variovorax sp. J2L1-78]MDM0129284.1 hypothetical protein [Variovorax sp. J2L1-63]MDM0232929.1 hypothetical protein [Variovorax sp. J2R1-6]
MPFSTESMPRLTLFDSTATKTWAQSLIRAGQRAWAVTATERNTLPSSRSTPEERRRRWRTIGEALMLGRDLSTDVTEFNQWCIKRKLQIDGRTRAAAIWYAENWGSVEAIAGNACHPEVLRRLHRTSDDAMNASGQVDSFS